MYLLSRQVMAPDTSLAAPIRDHLARLAQQPENAVQPLLRQTCRRLLAHWESRENDAGRVAARFKLARGSSVH
jgi:hypothetical protein